MHGLIITVDFHLQGCSSLKEKRGRLRGAKERIGRYMDVAVMESDFRDSLQQSQWTFIILGERVSDCEKKLAEIERNILQFVDAVVLNLSREPL